jgi:CubicO group peptidase (beta-lactamase class C family)
MNSAKRWGFWKRISIAVAAVFLLSVLALSAFIASEWTYVQRLRHFRAQRPTPPEWFEPKEIVRGAESLRPLGHATPEQAGISTNTIQKARDAAIAGNALSFVIAKDGQIVTEFYAAQHGPQKWTDSASMMKTVTALLCGIAIAEGGIKSVDETAATYLPAWAKDGRAKITLRHLLRMHSGLRPEGEYEDPFSDACYLALGTDARYVVEGAPLVCAPGTRYDYNNVNYQALGMILEAATGRRYAQYLSEKLWVPLGNAEAAVWLDKKDGHARTFGFLFATAHDWLRLGQLILDRGQVGGKQLAPVSWIDFMCTPSPTEPTYGAGIYTGIDDPDDQPFPYPGVVAFNGKGKQRVYVLPKERILILRVGPQVKGWDDGYFPNLLAWK